MSNFPKTGNVERNTAESEHVGPDTTGDNVHAKRVVGYQFDGTNWVRAGLLDNVAVRITTVGGDTYIAKAAPGTLVSAAQWQIKKMSASEGDIATTYADGNAKYDNVASNPSTLEYS